MNVEANVFHPAVGAEKAARDTFGIDVGLHAFVVAANSKGEELWRSSAPSFLKANLRRLARRLFFKKPYLPITARQIEQNCLVS